ncbi:MAG TPA: hypothetical protein VF988_11940 [Verrucomicrobiae bacterium]
MKKPLAPRKRFTLAEREAILARYQRGQLTQQEFAQQQGIGLSTLQRWLHKATDRKGKGPAFLAVPNLLASAPPPPAYRIAWPGGLAVEVRAGFVVPELAALLQLLPPL